VALSHKASLAALRRPLADASGLRVLSPRSGAALRSADVPCGSEPQACWIGPSPAPEDGEGSSPDLGLSRRLRVCASLSLTPESFERQLGDRVTKRLKSLAGLPRLPTL
jgi:hypothetical protein